MAPEEEVTSVLMWYVCVNRNSNRTQLHLPFHVTFHTNTPVQKGKIRIGSIASTVTAINRSLKQLVHVSSFSFLGSQSLSWSSQA